MTVITRKVNETKFNVDKQLSVHDMYAALEWYYHNNAVYQMVQQAAFEAGVYTEQMMGLRNPANRVVEFYVGKLCPGKDGLAIETKDAQLQKAVEQVLIWSNFAVKKQPAVRTFAMKGDVFFKVSSRRDVPEGPVKQVFIQEIKPEYVTKIESDERGFLVYVRIDIPSVVEVDGNHITVYYTEEFYKDAGTHKIWPNNKYGPKKTIKGLGSPDIEKKLSDYGGNFIPVVQGMFKDVGEDYGTGAFTHALDKIDEANRMATRLHQLLFRYNRAIWALKANAASNDGRPLPPPQLGDGSGSDTEGETVTLGADSKEDTLVKLPGYSELDSLIPDIKYAEALSILQDQMAELEADLPELAYYRLKYSTRELSGIAVRYLLGDAIDKVREARGNFFDALVRSLQMALTIGQNNALFPGLAGSYEAGSFDFTFREGDVIALSEKERSEIYRNYKAANMPTAISAERAGFSDEDVQALVAAEKQQKLDDVNSLAKAMLEQERRFNNPDPQPDSQDV